MLPIFLLATRLVVSSTNVSSIVRIDRHSSSRLLPAHFENEEIYCNWNLVRTTFWCVYRFSNLIRIFDQLRVFLHRVFEMLPYRNLQKYEYRVLLLLPLLLSFDIFGRLREPLSKFGSFLVLDNSVGIAIGYGLDGQGSIPSKGKIFLSTPPCPDRLWTPPSVLSNGYRGLFPRG
jgi:hypothetical protein